PYPIALRELGHIEEPAVIENLWFVVPKNVRIAIIILLTIALWQLAVTIFEPPEILIPSPAEVIKRIASFPNFYLVHSWRTLLETVVGFGLALAIGIVLSVLIVSSRLLEETIYTVLIA